MRERANPGGAANKHRSSLTFIIWARKMASVSLLIRGNDVDPAEVTRLLRLKPTRTWMRGDAMVIAGKATRKIHRVGGWHLWSTPNQRNHSMSWHVSRWSRLLSSRRQPLREISEMGWEVSLDCCVAGKSDAFRLSPRFAQKLADAGVTFAFTCYAPLE